MPTTAQASGQSSTGADSLLVACPHCDTLNRVPPARLGGGKCGRCGNTLFEGKPVALDARRFAAHAERGALPVLIDFWAEWCGPCRMMAPHFEEAARRNVSRARFAKVNSDDEPALSSRFGIRSIPTLMIFLHGKEIARQSGAMDLGNLERWGDAW